MQLNDSTPLATLEPVRFGEFLRDRRLIDDEQWLAALADHWSAPRHRRIGDIIVERGFLSEEVVEAEARAFHDDLAVIEVGEIDVEIDELDELEGDARVSEMITAPVVRMSADSAD